MLRSRAQTLPGLTAAAGPGTAEAGAPLADAAGTGSTGTGSTETGTSRSWLGSRAWLPVLIPVLAALLSGSYRLGVPSLWRDEAATADAAQRSLPQIMSLLRHVDAVNGTYYLLMHAVITALGSSAQALRLPSALAMAVAAAVTAALGRRLAAAAGLRAPAVTGTLAGLLLTADPQAIRYAQEARAYGVVTMLATIASYLLVRAAGDGRRRWWAGYAAVIMLAGLFNVFSLLLLPAHAVTVLLGPGRGRAGRPVARGWTTAAAAGALAVSPLLVIGYLQGRQIGWLGSPSAGLLFSVVSGFAGSRWLLFPVTLLAVCGVAAGRRPRRAHALTPGVLALPWLVLPTVILFIAALTIHPVFTNRYVVFSLPALAVLVAAGLSWLAEQAGAVIGRARPGRPAAAASWLPPAVVLVILAVMLAGPEQAMRQPYSRADNLRQAAAVLAAQERPGDAVFYLPTGRRIMSFAYPDPFRRLRDIALLSSPAASGTLNGTEVTAATLTSRAAGVQRIWLITVASGPHLPAGSARVNRAKIALIGRMRQAGLWDAGAVRLRLYARQ